MTRKKPQRDALAFGRRLRQLRMKRGLSQRDLAEHCGLTPEQVSHYEAGRHRPLARNLARLARELDVAVATLAGSLAAPQARPGRRRSRG